MILETCRLKKHSFTKNCSDLSLWINCSSDLKNFANSQPSASLKSFSRSLELFFLKVSQNNLVTFFSIVKQFVKISIHSFGLSCWIQWARYSPYKYSRYKIRKTKILIWIKCQFLDFFGFILLAFCYWS